MRDPSSDPVSIVLIEDHRIVREGIRDLIRGTGHWRVVAESGLALEGIELVRRTRPDVLIVDLNLPDMSGLEVVRRVRSGQPTVRIVVLTMHRDDRYIVESLAAGANAYVLKDDTPEEFLAAVRGSLAGERYLSSSLPESTRRRALEAPGERAAEGPGQLSAREREILALVASGRSSREIAEELSLSPRTIDSHRANILRKLGLKHQAEMVGEAVRLGLIAIAPGPPPKG